MKAGALVAAALVSLQACSAEPVGPDCPSLLSGWTQPKDGLDHHGIHSSVTMAGKQVLWNERTVSDTEFEKLLRLAPTLNPTLHVLFDPSGAHSCQQAEQVRDRIDHLADCRGKGLCGQGKLHEFISLRDSGAVWRAKMEATGNEEPR